MANYESKDQGLMIGPEIASAMTEVILHDSVENRTHLSELRERLSSSNLTDMQIAASERTNETVGKILTISSQVGVEAVSN